MTIETHPSAKPRKRWRRPSPALITVLQGYVGMALLAVSAGLVWGLAAGIAAAGALLLADAWRPPPRPKPSKESKP